MLAENELGVKVGRISDKMPSDWTYMVLHQQYGRSEHYLEHTSGASLHCSISYPHRRLMISGVFPSTADRHFAPYVDQKFFITVSPDRDNAAIAKDIMQRLVPDYLAAYASAVEQMNEHIGRLGQQAAIVDKLADALGTEASPGHDEIYMPSRFRARCTFRVHLNGSVEIRNLYDLTLDQALQIIDILATDKRNTG